MKKIFRKLRTKTDLGDSIVVCPVCGKKYLSISIKMHIHNTARSEVWKVKMREIKKTPHLDFYLKYTKKCCGSRHWIV